MFSLADNGETSKEKDLEVVKTKDEDKVKQYMQ